jgi:uncharacterized protein YecE (DUF72 family)
MAARSAQTTARAAPHDPGVAPARERAEEIGGELSSPIETHTGGLIRIGTAGWTDPTLTAAGAFYPPGVDTPEDRLRYYASRFSLVEVDSTYYALPARRMAALWLERTPPEFTFNVKAHALMTGQPTEVRRLPRDLREALPSELAAKERFYAKDLPRELYDAVWTYFRDAIEPLHSAGKLGTVLLQYPRWFMPGGRSRQAILEARDRLADVDAAVEFRNSRWFTPRNAESTLAFLANHGIPYVIVDEPQGLPSSVPPVTGVTSPRIASLRFHGRRADTWEKPGVGVQERFRYLYDRGELAEWVPRIQEVAAAARETHVVMNNCYANYGTTNAAELGAMLRAAYGQGQST